jgi:hypothetical protein
MSELSNFIQEFLFPVPPLILFWHFSAFIVSLINWEKSPFLSPRLDLPAGLFSNDLFSISPPSSEKRLGDEGGFEKLPPAIPLYPSDQSHSVPTLSTAITRLMDCIAFPIREKDGCAISYKLIIKCQAFSTLFQQMAIAAIAIWKWPQFSGLN